MAGLDEHWGSFSSVDFPLEQLYNFFEETPM